MNRLKFEILKRKYPESRIWSRWWIEQKTRNKITKAIKDEDSCEEKQYRIQYITQKINWKTTIPLDQDDLEFILSLSSDELRLLPWQPSEKKKYFYCAELFWDKKLDADVWKSLKEEAAEYAYWMLKDGIEEDVVFKYISMDTALKYLSQHELADIMTYNTNFWTYPYWQLDTLADYFCWLPELDPLEYAKKFEAQVGIRGYVPNGWNPISNLVFCCKKITPEFEEYLIEKWYEKELKKRKERDEKENSSKSEDTPLIITTETENSSLQGEIEKDKADIGGKIDAQKEMINYFRGLDNKRYEDLYWE